MTTGSRVLRRLAPFLGALLACGCVSQPPTIAHVHVGHALTGAHDTPDRQGYFVLAEERARAARMVAEERVRPGRSMDALQLALEDLNRIVNEASRASLTGAVEEAVNHLQFAAESDDASANLRRSVPVFARNSEGVLYRTSLVNLYVQDALASRSREEMEQLAEEVRRVVVAIEAGEDLDGNGFVGDTPREFGLRQLRSELEAMVGREEPPYATVDQWYLMNLVRMPSGDWIFRRGGSTSGANY